MRVPIGRVSVLAVISLLFTGFSIADETTNDEIGNDEARSNGAPVYQIENRADILVITNSELADSWRPFAEWKTSTGRPTKIVTTDFVGENYSGDDIQQQIRACCLEHIKQEKTKWVVLGGDSSADEGIVPDRDTDHSDFQMLPYDNIPTDIYYISEKDWDANDDGKYGVFADDLAEVAYYNPKASIGRIPVRTSSDVAAYTDKVIAYESRYPVGDFARRMVYTCPENSAYPKLETSMEEVEKSWSAGYISRFFGDRTAWDESKRGEHDLTPENLVQMINDRQASKIHIHGHGLLHIWVLEKHREMSADEVAKLENENAYPIITTVSCLTGQYDDRQDPCISESMLRHPKGGAIAILAPSREGVPFMKSPQDFRLMMTEGKMDGTTTAYTKFWKIALAEDLTIGEAFRKVKMEMEGDARENDGFHMAQCELNLLGDPSIKARPAAPDSFAARARLSDNTLKLSGVPNAKVCIWDGEQDLVTHATDEKGELEVTLKSPERTYRITAMAPGFNIWATTTDSEEIASDNNGEGKDFARFREYIAERIPGIGEEQLDAIAKALDKDGDGKISEVEQENRMKAIQSIMQGGRVAAGRKPGDKEKTESKKLAKFREYVAEKIPDLNDKQLDAIAKAADKNGDGMISDSEFEGRRAAIQSVLGS